MLFQPQGRNMNPPINCHKFLFILAGNLVIHQNHNLQRFTILEVYILYWVESDVFLEKDISRANLTREKMTCDLVQATLARA